MVQSEDCVKVGTISKSHGLDGCVIVTCDSNLLEKHHKEPVFIVLDGRPVPFFISKINYRNHKSLLVKFDYIDNRDDAEKLSGCDLLMESRVVDIPDDDSEVNDDFELEDLEGFSVVDSISGKTGRVDSVSDYSGNVILNVLIEEQEVLLPLFSSFISSIDAKHREIHASIPEDLFSLN